MEPTKYLFENDYCEKNLRYEGVRGRFARLDCTILFIKLNLTLFFDSLPGFSQQFSFPGKAKKEWDITFETDDDNYKEVKSILGAILFVPNQLGIRTEQLTS